MYFSFGFDYFFFLKKVLFLFKLNIHDNYRYQNKDNSYPLAENNRLAQDEKSHHHGNRKLHRTDDTPQPQPCMRETCIHKQRRNNRPKKSNDNSPFGENPKIKILDNIIFIYSREKLFCPLEIIWSKLSDKAKNSRYDRPAKKHVEASFVWHDVRSNTIGSKHRSSKR